MIDAPNAAAGPPDDVVAIKDEPSLLAVCVALGATQCGGELTASERELVAGVAHLSVAPALVTELTRAIQNGMDALGDTYCELRPPEDRREMGQFYTGPQIVRGMLEWVFARDPARIVDAGCGSGRYAVAARRFGFKGQLIATDLDPLSTLMTRATLAAAGYDARVIQGDFLRTKLPVIDGKTAFVGNPPYVRHHDLDQETKAWAKTTARALGIEISGLAGLHALFILAAGALSRPGDFGSFITSAEWLDTKYGQAVRELFAGQMGLTRMDVVDPKSIAFDDAMTTAIIVSWDVGYTGSVAARRVKARSELEQLDGGRKLARTRLAESRRWSELFGPARKHRTELVPLSTYARVHRGVATGANSYFAIRREDAVEHGIDKWCRPVISRAAQVISADGKIRSSALDKVLLDLPVELPDDDEALLAYIADGLEKKIDDRYLCKHRKPWWRVGGKEAPQIVVTYMARRPPAFALNPERCQVLNVAHGIRFTDEVTEEQARALVEWLNANSDHLEGAGRTYHGGLQKFEPSEMEAILVPSLEALGNGSLSS